jgi:hypothetical protein
VKISLIFVIFWNILVAFFPQKNPVALALETLFEKKSSLCDHPLFDRCKVVAGQGCQIFLGAKYQKYTKLPQTIINVHKL